MPVKTLLVALFALSAAGALRAEDSREGVVLPAPAQAVLRRGMLDNLLALKKLLDAKVSIYNNPAFIAADPISVPH